MVLRQAQDRGDEEMRIARQERMPESNGQLYALSPDYRPELKPGHVLFDREGVARRARLILAIAAAAASSLPN
jgi:hypothetical protein